MNQYLLLIQHKSYIQFTMFLKSTFIMGFVLICLLLIITYFLQELLHVFFLFCKHETIFLSRNHFLSCQPFLELFNYVFGYNLIIFFLRGEKVVLQSTILLALIFPIHFSQEHLFVILNL